MKIEIQVYDQITVVESLGDVTAYVTEAIREWYNNPESDPKLVITLSKIEDRAPPAIGINVSEIISMKEAFG